MIRLGPDDHFHQMTTTAATTVVDGRVGYWRITDQFSGNEGEKKRAGPRERGIGLRRGIGWKGGWRITYVKTNDAVEPDKKNEKKGIYIYDHEGEEAT